MSIRASNWAWNLLGEVELSDGQKLILLRLADHADTEGLCWPGNASIATTLGCSERTVERAKARLRELGLVATEPRLLDDGKGRKTDAIQLRIDQPDTGVGMGQDQPDTRDATNPTPQTDQPDTRDVASVLREPPGTPRGTVSDIPPTLGLDGTGSADLGLPKWLKVDRLKVSEEEWKLSLGILAVWNRETEQNLSALTSRKQPQEALKRIIARIREMPELTLADHENLIRRTLAHPWWERDAKPQVGHIYGPNAFVRCVHNDRPTGRRTFEGERRTDPANAPW